MTTLGGSSPQIRSAGEALLCPCWAGQSISYWDGLGDTSSIVQGGGNRVTDRYGTGALGELTWLGRACQCDQRQNSSGIWWDPTMGLDWLMPKLLCFWHGPANYTWLLGVGSSCEKSFQTFCVGNKYCPRLTGIQKNTIGKTTLLLDTSVWQYCLSIK